MRASFSAPSLVAGICLAWAAMAAEKSETAPSPTLVTTQRTEQADAQRMAQRFIEQINAARISLSLEQDAQAQAAIAQAQSALSEMTTPNYRQLRTARIGSAAADDSDSKPYYFPVEIDAGPVAVKKMETGPIWQKNGIAVTDAEIVYLTLDLKDQSASSALQKASDAIVRHHRKSAQTILARLIEDTIQVETAVTVPVEKARDNIFLTREFIRAHNYDGARYALGHASEALDSMEQDTRYATRKGALSTMRKEVHELKLTIEKRDPSLLTQADASLARWWQEMNEWRH